RLRLSLSPIADNHARPNRAAIRLYPSQLNLDPIRLAAEVVPQQGWRFVEVNDEHIQIAIIVEVSESAAPATVWCGDAGAGGLDQLFENPLAKISENSAWGFVGILWKLPSSFRINVARNHEQVGVAVIIKVDYACPPTHKAGFDSQARRP